MRDVVAAHCQREREGILAEQRDQGAVERGARGGGERPRAAPLAQQPDRPPPQHRVLLRALCGLAAPAGAAGHQRQKRRRVPEPRKDALRRCPGLREQSLASGFEARRAQAASALSNDVARSGREQSLASNFVTGLASGRSSPRLEVEVLRHMVGAAASQVQRSLLQKRQPNALRARRHRLDRRRRLLAQLPLPEQIRSEAAEKRRDT